MADGRIVIDTAIKQKGVDQGLKTMKDKINKASDKLQSAGKKMSLGLTAPIAGLGAVAFGAAKSFAGATKTMQNSLGVTKEEAEKLTETANDIYKKGFGESLDETTRALADVKKNMGELVDEAQLEDVTKQAMTLAKTMDEDVGFVTRASSTLMREFGDDSEKAMDLLAWGSQNGLNYSDELLDNISEYGPLFADMGYSSEEYFNILKKGTEEGSYNLDYLNDAMKEFQVKLNDGSAWDAVKSMSKSTQEVYESFQEGGATAKEVMKAITEEFGTMDKKMVDSLGPAIFGTKFEDLGQDAVIAMGKAQGGVEGLDGTMNKMVENTEKSLGAKWDSLLRTSTDALRPLGEILVELASNVLPPLIEKVTKVAEWFQNLSPAAQGIIVAVLAIVAAVGPLLVIVGQLVGSFMTILPILKTVGLAITGLSGPVMIIIGVIALLAILIYKYWDEIKAFTIASFKAIGNFLKASWEWISNVFMGAMEFLKNLFINHWDTMLMIVTGPIGLIVGMIIKNWDKIKAVTKVVFEAIGNFFVSIWEWITGAFKTAIEGISNFVSNAWNGIKSVTKTVFQAISGFISNIWNTMTGSVRASLDIMKNVISNVWGAIKGGASSAWNGIKSLVLGVAGSLKDKVVGVFNTLKGAITGVWDSVAGSAQSAWNGIKNTVVGAVNGIIGKINGMIGSLNGFSIKLPRVPDWVPGIGGKGGKSLKLSVPKIPSLDVGTNFVEQDGLAYIHRGEKIVPAKHNGPYSEGGEKIQLTVPIEIGGKELARAVVDDLDSEISNKRRRRGKAKGV